MDKKCINCSELNRCKDSYRSWYFFVIGLIATIAIRAVTIITHVSPLWGKVAWYIGVVGFLIFFVYKYKLSISRVKVIREKDLIGKINRKQNLEEEDYKALSAMLCALSSKKEGINYIFIFILSAIALIIAIYIDFF